MSFVDRFAPNLASVYRSPTDKFLGEKLLDVDYVWGHILTFPTVKLSRC